jgi:DNA mismatch repair protein MSH2
LGIDVQLSESGTYTFVFEANKKYADDAFRKKGVRKYKTLTVKKGNITFTVEQLQAEVAEYTDLRDQYSSAQKEVIDKILQIVSGYYPAMERASQCISELGIYGIWNIYILNRRLLLIRISRRHCTKDLCEANHIGLE